jgi:hypothetical protein
MSEHDKPSQNVSDNGGTITRKIKALQDLGVLDTPDVVYESTGYTTSIKTYPFAKQRHPSVNKVLGWFKKDE